MIGKHTPGRLNVAVEVFDNDGVPETVIQGLGAAASVAVALDFGANNKGMREANARRLVACWNYCEGVSTEHLEKYGMPDFAQKISDLREQRNELLEALKGVLAVASVRIDDPRIAAFDAAREAIAKATGAQA